MSNNTSELTAPCTSQGLAAPQGPLAQLIFDDGMSMTFTQKAGMHVATIKVGDLEKEFKIAFFYWKTEEGRTEYAQLMKAIDDWVEECKTRIVTGQPSC